MINKFLWFYFNLSNILFLVILVEFIIECVRLDLNLNYLIGKNDEIKQSKK